MEFNLADLFEAAVDAYADTRVPGGRRGQRRTYAEMEARANRLAHHLAARGIGPGDHVGIYSYNTVEWVETAWAVVQAAGGVDQHQLPLRRGRAALPLLQRRPDGPRPPAPVRPHGSARSLPGCPNLRHLLVVEDGTDAESPPPTPSGYEDALAAASPERDFGRARATTSTSSTPAARPGMPKGVVWRHEDVFYALGGGADPITNTRVTDPEEMVREGPRAAS